MRTTMATTVLLLALASAPAIHAVGIPVNTTDDELNSDGDCSLREAVRSANMDVGVDACDAGNGADWVMLPAGTFTLSVTGTLENQAATGDLDLTEGVSIVGVGAADTIVDGNDIDRVFDVQTGEPVELDSLTIRNGTSAVGEFGGAVHADIGADLRIADARIESSVSPGGGGGIYARSADLTVERSVITGNSTTGFGGGVYLSEADTSITDCTIDDNDAQSGGGLATAGSSTAFVVHVTGTTISNNDATNVGGGIITTNFCSLTLQNSTVSGNTANSGGGIETSFTDALWLFNTTITNNTANGGSAGGLVHGSGTGFTALNNTIVAGNIGNAGADPDCFGTLTSEGYNLIGVVDCTITGTTTGNVTGVSANLSSLGDFGGPTLTHVPQPGSPAINAGDPAAPDSGGTSCAPLDQRGATRPGNGRCDMGAVESEATPPTTTTTTTTSTSTSTVTTTSTTSTTTTSSSSSTTTTTSTSTTTTSTSGPAPTSTTTTTTLPPPPPTSTTLPPGPPPICVGGVPMSGATLKIAKVDGDPGDEKLVFKGIMEFPADTPPALEPITHGLQIVIDEPGFPPTPLLVLAAQTGGVPPGGRGSGCDPKDGWRNTIYTNRSGAVPPDCPSGSAHGLRTIKLKDFRAKGKGIKLLVKAAGATIPAPENGVRATIVLGNRAEASLAGLCAEHEFVPSQCRVARSKVSCR